MIKTKKAPKAPKGKGFKLQAKPLTEELIQKFIAHFNQYGSFPGQKIPCTVTGKLTTCVGPWLKKKVKEFGSAEALLRNYKCRGVTKKPKTEKPPGKKGRKKSAAKITIEGKPVYDIPKIDLHQGPRPLSADEITECSISSCFRPDLFLNNDRSCNGCQFFDLCKNSNKNLKSLSKKTVRRK
jgi:hypothetical protein